MIFFNIIVFFLNIFRQTFEKKETFRCLTYIFSEKTLVAGTEENNIYCFEINEIFDLDIKNHEFKYLEPFDEKSKPEINSKISSSPRINTGNSLSFDYIIPENVIENLDTIKETEKNSG